MTDYISREEAIEALGEMPLNWTDSPEELQEVADWEEHLHAIMAVPAADVVPWEWLESYSYMFCACWFSSTVEMDSYKVLYLNFIREAKRFYKASLAAMEGGHIGD